MEEKYVLEDKVIIPKDYLEMTEEELQKKIDEQLAKDGKKQDKVSKWAPAIGGCLKFFVALERKKAVTLMKIQKFINLENSLVCIVILSST